MLHAFVQTGSQSQCTAARPRGLSMNSTMPRLQMNKLRSGGAWSQCMRKKRKGAFHEPTRSAGCQPAVSPTASRRSVEQNSSSAPCERPAGWQPAKQQTGQSAPLSSMHRKVARASRVPPGVRPRPWRANSNRAKRLNCGAFHRRFRTEKQPVASHP